MKTLTIEFPQCCEVYESIADEDYGVSFHQEAIFGGTTRYEFDIEVSGRIYDDSTNSSDSLGSVAGCKITHLDPIPFPDLKDKYVYANTNCFDEYFFYEWNDVTSFDPSLLELTVQEKPDILKFILNGKQEYVIDLVDITYDGKKPNENSGLSDSDGGSYETLYRYYSGEVTHFESNPGDEDDENDEDEDETP